MSKTPLLSICIPNYNRPEMLAQNLEALAGEYLQDKTEIVVSDDCSKQPVTDVIMQFQKKHPRINLHFTQQQTNLGFDRHVLEIIKLAHGKYCWLLSNDDKVLPGSIARIITLLEEHPALSLINLNYQRYDYILGKITADRMVVDVADHHFLNADDYFFHPTPKSYFKYLGVNTLTMSADVVRRDWWLEAAKNVDSYIGHNFIHVFQIVDMISSHPDIYFIGTPQVEYLCNNHRVWANDIWKDYNLFLIDRMAQLGFNPGKLAEMRQYQRRYEAKETLGRIQLVVNLHRFLSRQLARFGLTLPI